MKTKLLLISLLLLTTALTGCDQWRRMTGTGDPNDPAVAVPHPPPVANTPPPPYHIFLADGQSNMVGGHQEYNFEHFDHFKPNGSSYPYKGPAVGFARAYIAKHPDRYVKIVNCALGGTPITAHQEGGALFEVCLGNLREFMGPNDTVDGVLWWQGEQDAVDGMSGGQWNTLFTSYVNAMRRRLSHPDLPVIFVQIGVLLPDFGGEHFTQLTWDSIKQGQASFSMSNMAMVRSEDQTLVDHVHYDAQSNLTIGSRMFNAFEGIQ